MEASRSPPSLLWCRDHMPAALHHPTSRHDGDKRWTIGAPPAEEAVPCPSLTPPNPVHGSVTLRCPTSPIIHRRKLKICCRKRRASSSLAGGTNIHPGKSVTCWRRNPPPCWASATDFP